MSVEKTRTKPLFRDQHVTLGVVGQTPINALRQEELRLRMEGLDGTGETPIERAPVVSVFKHGVVEVGIEINLLGGTMRSRSSTMNRGDYQERSGNGGFYYWSQRFKGAASTKENMADFMAEAVEQIEKHQAAIAGSRLRGESLILN